MDTGVYPTLPRVISSWAYLVGPLCALSHHFTTEDFSISLLDKVKRGISSILMLNRNTAVPQLHKSVQVTD